MTGIPRRAIVLAAIIALLGAGAYLTLHKEEEEWGRFCDEEFAFSFSYPPSWDLKYRNIPEELLGGAEKGCVVAVSTKAGLGMAIEVRKENLTLEELRENHLAMWENFSLEIVEEENCEVGGVPAIRWRIEDGGLHEVIFGVKGDRWYSLVAPVSDPYWETFDRIIVSFSIKG